jgi:hypothetical protein
MIPNTIPTRHGAATRLVQGAALVAAIALGVQAAHLLEHAVQLGYWFTHPRDAPWMSPWAMELKHRLAIGGDHALGAELLHLMGNSMFLGGLVALVAVRRASGQTFAAMGHLRSAVRVQALHMAEHVALTSTVLFGSRAIGVSTFFGLVDGSGTTWWRVWFHFLINLVATSYAGLAVLERRGSRAVMVREADAGCATWRETVLCRRNGWGRNRPRAM